MGCRPRRRRQRPWHDAWVTDQEARYDRLAEGYAEWWSPVHRPGTLALLDEVAADVADGARRMVDVGCGTGALAVEAVTRWPDVEVDGIDASAGMLEVAMREASSLPPILGDRVRLRQATADRLPFADATFDVALSAFVLQLVPSRPGALREMRRVLRPRGRLAYVTWLRGGEPFPGDAVYDEARREVGLEPRWSDDDAEADGDEGDGTDDDFDADPGDNHVPSPEVAVAQLRRAGFSDVRARGSVLEHGFTPWSYVGFISRFDDEDEFATMEPRQREALEHRLLERLARLSADRLVMRMPVVYVTGIRTR